MNNVNHLSDYVYYNQIYCEFNSEDYDQYNNVYE